jgi:hypothetical protein
MIQAAREGKDTFSVDDMGNESGFASGNGGEKVPPGGGVLIQ